MTVCVLKKSVQFSSCGRERAADIITRRSESRDGARAREMQARSGIAAKLTYRMRYQVPYNRALCYKRMQRINASMWRKLSRRATKGHYWARDHLTQPMALSRWEKAASDTLMSRDTFVPHGITKGCMQPPTRTDVPPRLSFLAYYMYVRQARVAAHLHDVRAEPSLSHVLLVRADGAR